jgi:hypothetical protein
MEDMTIFEDVTVRTRQGEGGEHISKVLRRGTFEKLNSNEPATQSR